MRKENIFIALFAIILSIQGVFAASIVNQGVRAYVLQEIIDISVNSIDYGDILPGEEVFRDSNVTVNDANTVDLTVNIQVSDPGTGNLFHHIWFDVESNGFSDDAEIGTGTETLNLDDLPFSPFGSHFTQTIPTKLVVPADFSSFGDITGIVAYTAMKRV
jgi:hypothetical protein